MSFKQFEIIFVKALGKTKELLFPFSLKKWIILVFIAAMAGAMGGGGSIDIPARAFDPSSFSESAGGTSQEQGDALVQGEDPSLEPRSSESKAQESLAVGLIILRSSAVILFLVLPFWLLFLWISCRFRFIFYNSAIFKTTAIKLPWVQYKMQGNSLFKGKIVLGLIVGVIAGIIGGLTFATTMGGDYTSLLFFIPLILLFFGSVVFLFHYIDQFVVPIMAIENKKFSESFTIFRSLFSENKKLFIVYVFVAIGLGLACGVIVGLAMLAVFLVYALVGLIIFGGAYAIFGTGAVFVIICIFVGVPFLLALFLTLYLALVPIAYFYRNFTLYYLMESGCDYDFYGDRELGDKQGDVVVSLEISDGTFEGKSSSASSSASYPPPLPSSSQA
jgi:hypothetical protein